MRFILGNADAKHEKHILTKGDGLRHNAQEFCDFSVMIGCHYLGLDICTLDNYVYGISGYVSIERLPKGAIRLPQKICLGSLKICDCEIIPGTVKDYDNQLEGVYDPRLNCICLGKNDPNIAAVRIAEDVIASVVDGKIVAIYIMPTIG